MSSSTGTGQRGHQLVEQPGELATVLRYMQAGVVVQIDRRESEVGSQRLPMVVAVARPLQVVHAQAMHQHQQACAWPGPEVQGKAAREVQRLTAAAQGHRDREWIGGVDQVVAPHAVERRNHRFTRQAAGIGWPDLRDRAEREVQTLADGARGAAHRTVDGAGDPRSLAGWHAARQVRDGRNRVMHRLDDLGDAQRGVNTQLRQSAQIGSPERQRRDCDRGGRWRVGDGLGGHAGHHGWAQQTQASSRLVRAL